jgi:hypothetical protein
MNLDESVADDGQVISIHRLLGDRYNGLCNRRPLLSRDSKAFEHFTAECYARATVLAFHNEEVGHRETHADREFARELWNLSETLTGIYFQTEGFALFCCAL